MSINDFSIKHGVAVIKPFTDSEMKVSLTVSPRYSIFTVNGTEYYFLRESGEFDGTGKAVASLGPILVYDREGNSPV